MICLMTAMSSLRGVDRLLDGGDDGALDGAGRAGNPRAGCSRMTAATELTGNVTHVHVLAFGAQTDTRKVGFNFLEDTSHDDRFDGPNVIMEFTMDTPVLNGRHHFDERIIVLKIIDGKICEAHEYADSLKVKTDLLDP